MGNLVKLLKGQLMLMVVALLDLQTAYGQYNYFAKSGRIEFEKKVNMFAKLKARLPPGNVYMQKDYEEYRRTMPQFVTTKTSLSFNNEESLYQVVETPSLSGSRVAAREPWAVAKNTVFTNFESNEMVVVKDVFGEDIVMADKQPDILWKFTNEVRDIAGYECRRANGLIGDSVYVVAFYSVDILPKCGPESFSGLPGMILGVALPHEDVNWFATKVELVDKVQIKVPEAHNRAKQMNREELEAYLHENLKNWGDLGTEAINCILVNVFVTIERVQCRCVYKKNRAIDLVA